MRGLGQFSWGMKLFKSDTNIHYYSMVAMSSLQCVMSFQFAGCAMRVVIDYRKDTLFLI